VASKTYETMFLLGAQIQASMGKSFGQVQRYMAEAQTQASVGERAFSGFSGAIAGIGVTAGIAALGKGMIDNAADMQSYRNTLNVVMKDQELAAQTMVWAANYANSTPFDTKGVVEATVRLQSYGIAAQDVLPAVGDMASVMGKDLMQAVEAVADAQTGELERMKEFGITKDMIIAQAEKLRLGIVVNNKGQITDQENFNKAMFSLMNERFKGGTEMQSKTWKGVMSTISGTWQTTLAQMAGVALDGSIKQGSFFDVMTQNASKLSDMLVNLTSGGQLEALSQSMGNVMSTAVNGVSWVLDNWPLIEPIVITLTGAIAANEAATLAMVAAQKGGMIITALTTAWGTATTALALLREGYALTEVAQVALNSAMLLNPLTWIVAGIVAVVVAGVLLYRNWDTISQKASEVWGGVTAWFSKVYTTVTQFITNLPSYISSGISGAVQCVAYGIGYMIGYVATLPERVTAFVSATATAMVTTIGSGVNSTIQFFIDLPANAEGALSSFLATIDAWGSSVYQSVVNWVMQIPNAVSNAISSAGSFVQNLISGASSSLQSGMQASSLPAYADGTDYHPGGVALVGERGPELLRLPRGSQVTPNSRTQSLLNGLSGSGLTGTISVSYSPQYIIQGNADQNTLKTASDQSYHDFESRFNALIERRQRLSFA